MYIRQNAKWVESHRDVLVELGWIQELAKVDLGMLAKVDLGMF